jgi:hypothetical protein
MLKPHRLDYGCNCCRTLTNVSLKPACPAVTTRDVLIPGDMSRGFPWTGSRKKDFANDAIFVSIWFVV